MYISHFRFRVKSEFTFEICKFYLFIHSFLIIVFICTDSRTPRRAVSMQKIREVLAVETLESIIKHNRGSSLLLIPMSRFLTTTSVINTCPCLSGPLFPPPLPTALHCELMKARVLRCIWT